MSLENLLPLGTATMTLSGVVAFTNAMKSLSTNVLGRRFGLL